MANSLDATALVNIAKNRSRLLKLADGIRTRKKPGSSKKCLRLDPAYTNIEHLVFGTYRTRSSTPDTSRGAEKDPAPPPPPTETSSPKRALSEPKSGCCECSKHSPHLRPPSTTPSAPARSETDRSDRSHNRHQKCTAEQRRSQNDGGKRRDDMAEQRGRSGKPTDEQPAGRCISWRDVAAASKQRDEAARSHSVRLYCTTDKSNFERQNTFPSGIPKPVAIERHRTRQQHGKTSSPSADSTTTPTRQCSRKASLQDRERSPGQQLRNGSPRKNYDDSTDVKAVTCKIRVTPPNGPVRNGKPPQKNVTPRSPTSNSKTVDSKAKVEDSRVRTRSKGHQHGMQNAVQKGDRQAPRRSTPSPSPKKTEPGTVSDSAKSDDRAIQTVVVKTTWAQIRSKSIEANGCETQSLFQGTRRHRSLDDGRSDGPTLNRVEFDLSKYRPSVKPTEPVSLPVTPQHQTDLKPITRSPRSELRHVLPEGPVSLPLPCEDEDSTIMSETSLPRSTDEVQIRARSGRMGSPSKHIDLRLLAAFQRFGDEQMVKEALEGENWMSDIEERDENSSSGASRAPSEEPQEQTSKSPGKKRPKGVSLGLERLLETPRNVSIISIKSSVDGASSSSHNSPSLLHRIQDNTLAISPPDVARDSISANGGLASPLAGREQTSVTRRGAMNLSTPPAKSPSWDKSVPVESVVQSNCHLLVQDGTGQSGSPSPLASPGGHSRHQDPSPTRGGTLERRPAKPTCPAPLPPSTPVHSTCRLLRNRPISRSERHLKTTSSPEIRAAATVDSGSVKDVRRPWSEVYCEVEACNLLGQANCQSVPNFPDFEVSSLPSGTPESAAGHSFFHRLTTVRATDSMLQKFRKTFSLRFQRNGRGGESEDLPDRSVEGSPLTTGQQTPREDAGVFKMGLGALRDRKNCKSRQKKENRSSKCNSADSGIQVEAACASSDGTNEANSAEDSPAVVRRRTLSQGHDGMLKNNNRPVSDFSADDTLTSVLDQEQCSEKGKDLEEAFQELDTFNVDDKLFTPVRRTPSVERQMSTPPPIKVRSERIRPKIRRQKARARLRRSISQPLDLEKMGVHHKSIENGLSDQEGSREPSTESSEEEFFSDNEGTYILSPALPKQPSYREMYEDTVTFAEALWDHLTIDHEELSFKAGEVIEVTDSSDKDWWWGAIGNKSGWFPAAFVRLRVSQEATVEDCILRMSEGALGIRHCQQQSRKMSVSLLSNDQVRANIVKEIVTTEKDFVRHLRDVVDGYLSQVRRRPDMFTEEHISTIFGNIAEIYQFQSIFLKHLESSINWQLPHLSEIGHCFLLHKDHFRIYSEYCNNHPLAVSQLQELYADSKYIHFFEACRLLQEMIDISLDGFLLTPVQKICKYPLQLAELLKYTRQDHPDYQLVSDALTAMRGVAQLVNERKRRMECLERLIEWQRLIEGWEDGDLIDSSSMLIYSGEVTRVTSSWSRDLVLFLFDHNIVYCKKDLLKRNVHVYRGRINLDHCCVFDVEDGKDAQFGITVRNAWKIHCNSRDKWFLFYAKSPLEKARWLQAFREERQQVIEDREQGFQIADQDKKAAKLAVLNKSKVKRPRAKIPKGPRPHPDTAVVELLLDSSGPKTRSGSLPSNLNPAVIVNGNTQTIPPKKKGSGWFHFGSGKKTKK